MTSQRASANNPGLSALKKYIYELESKTCRLSELAALASSAQYEGLNGLPALLDVIEELSAEVNNALDSVNFPEAAQ
jgi:hypothetical protein